MAADMLLKYFSYLKVFSSFGKNGKIKKRRRVKETSKLGSDF